MTPLTAEQRKILINALVDNWLDRLADGCIVIDDDWLRDLLRLGHIGYVDLDDADLIDECEEYLLDEALEQVGLQDPEGEA